MSCCLRVTVLAVSSFLAAPLLATTPPDPPSFRVWFNSLEACGVGTCPAPPASCRFPKQSGDGDLNTYVTWSVTPVQGQANQWELSVTNKLAGPNHQCEINEVIFPIDIPSYRLNGPGGNDADDIVYEAQLLGTATKNNWPLKDCSPFYECWGAAPQYPGSNAAWGIGHPLFSPMIIVADDTKARITAATNWPPKHVASQWVRNRQLLTYPLQSIAQNATRTYRCMVAEVTGNAATGNHPWMLAADRYVNWLKPKLVAAGLSPVQYPAWMTTINGMISWGLQNVMDGYLASGQLETVWSAYRNDLPWLQFWGQMGDYGYNCHPDTYTCSSHPVATSCEPPGCDCSHQYQDFACDCCALDERLHPRYGPVSAGGCFDLVGFVTQTLNPQPGGPHAGYYTRPAGSLEDSCSYDWFLHWISRTKDWGANAFYMDTLGATYYGDPLFVANLFRDHVLPQDGFIEYMPDLYPVAAAVSGTLQNAGYVGGAGHTIDDLKAGTCTSDPSSLCAVPFSQLGSYVMNDKILFEGEGNGQELLWGNGINQTTPNYWAERQAFLLGHRFLVTHPFEDWGDIAGSRDQLMGRAIDLWNQDWDATAPGVQNWWSIQPRYKDRKGITHIPTGIDVRRFTDASNRTFLAFDNYNNLNGQWVCVDNRRVFAPIDRLSIVPFSTSYPLCSVPVCPDTSSCGAPGQCAPTTTCSSDQDLGYSSCERPDYTIFSCLTYNTVHLKTCTCQNLCVPTPCFCSSSSTFLSCGGQQQ